MYVVKKNIYAKRNSQKSTLLHNIVNPSKHQDRPNVGAVPGQRRRRWTNTEPTQSGYPPSTHGTPAQRRTNAGPPSTTLAQHRSKHRADIPRPLDCVRLNQIYQ